MLIHAGLADCRMFDDQFGALSRHCQVLRYDMHGFGRSSWPDQPYTHHDALHELLDQLGIERVSLLGMSLGGGVALDFTLTYPGSVDALIAVAAGIGGFPQTDEDSKLFEPVVEAFTANDFTRAIDLMIHIWLEGPHRSSDDVDPTIRERLRALYTDVLLRTREGGRQPDSSTLPPINDWMRFASRRWSIVGSGDIPAVQIRRN